MIKILDMFADIDTVTKNAIKVGLDKVDDVEYLIVKRSAKKKSSTLDDTFEVGPGHINLIGSADEVFITMIHSDGTKLFRTSPVTNITPTENGYKFETLNSLYELVRT